MLLFIYMKKKTHLIFQIIIDFSISKKNFFIQEIGFYRIL